MVVGLWLNVVAKDAGIEIIAVLPFKIDRFMYVAFAFVAFAFVAFAFVAFAFVAFALRTP